MRDTKPDTRGVPRFVALPLMALLVGVVLREGVRAAEGAETLPTQDSSATRARRGHSPSLPLQRGRLPAVESDVKEQGFAAAEPMAHSGLPSSGWGASMRNEETRPPAAD